MKLQKLMARRNWCTPGSFARAVCIGLCYFITPFISGCKAQMSESVMDPSKGLNGGFEAVVGSLPVNWLVYTPRTTGSGDFSIDFDKLDPQEGNQSLRFIVRQCSAKGGRYSPGIAQELPAKVGESYKVTFRVRNTGSDFQFSITGVDAFNKSAGPLLRIAEAIPSWRKYEYVYKMPAPMKRLRLEVSVLSPGTFWIDGISVAKIGDQKK